MILGRFFAILFFFISFTFGGINYYYFLEGMYFPKLLFTFIFSLMNMFIFSFFPGPKVNFFDASNPKFNWKEDWFFKSKKKERIIWIFGNFLSIIIYILLDEYFQEGNPFSIKSLFTFLIVIIIGFIMVKLSKFTIFEER